MSLAAPFQVFIPSTETAADILEVWQTVPAPPGGPAGTRDLPAPPDSLVWRVALPGDEAAATALLDRQALRLFGVQAFLPLASQRLEQFVEDAPRPRGGQRGVDPGGFAQYELAPERDLARLLTETGGAAASRDLQGSLARGIEWQAISQQATAFLAQARQALAYYAWVETSAGAAPFGRTVVTWLGDVDTAWLVGLDRHQAALHQRATALALDTRAAWLRMALLVAAGSARLSVLFANPSTALLAIPAAWKFINQVLAEFKQIQSLLST